MNGDAAHADINALLEDARRHLVNTGTRNPLVHFNLQRRRLNSLEVIHERSEDLYEILRRKEKAMLFKAMETDQDTDPDEVLLEEGNDEAFDESRYTDNYIETPLGPEGLQKSLLRLAREARTAEEEQGINILYLALGFLTWYEDTNSNVERTAPLVLLPVELDRKARGNKFRLRARLDDLSTNLSLRERLAEMSVTLPAIEDGEDFSPEGYFDQVREAVESQPRWSVSDDTIRLGFFSFAKLLMLNDLKPENWPGGEMPDNPLLQTLLTGGALEEPPAALFANPDDRLDELLDPADIIQVVDADASQTKVIEEVRHGSNLVVQGPPGTGKSQTITNLIAAAVYDGKTVLFMAEKMAALKVVQNRLESCGLGEAVLELHSNKANKKDFVESLKRTLTAAARGLEEPADATDELREVRDALNAHSDALHEPVPGCDYAPYEALTEQMELLQSKAEPPVIDQTDLAGLSRDQVQLTLAAIDRYVDVVQHFGSRPQHPYFGCRQLNLQPTDLNRLSAALDAAQQAIRQLQEALNDAESDIGECQVPGTLAAAEWRIEALTLLNNAPVQVKSWLETVCAHYGEPRFVEAIETAQAWRAQRESLLEWCIDEAWAEPLTSVRTGLARGVESLWARLLSGECRRARQTLAGLMRSGEKLSPAEQLERVDALIAGRRSEKTFEDETGYLQQVLGGDWRGISTPFEAITEVLHWYLQLASRDVDAPAEVLLSIAASGISQEHLGALRSQTAEARERLEDVLRPLDWSGLNEGALEQAPLAEMLARVESMEGRYPEWAQLERAARALGEQGQGELLGRIDAGELGLDQAKTEFRYALSEARWNHALKQIPQLEQLASIDRHRLVEQFQQLGQRFFSDTQVRILNQHLEQVPTGDAGQMGLLRGEMARQRGHKPVRRLIREAGEMIQRLKPVFMMSPISVAQFLPRGTLTFDLLVIDEASQVRPADALGAIIRAGQIVVVGDQQQLPPTSFFDRMTAGEDEDEEEDEHTPPNVVHATEMESVLTLCEARALPQRMLEWHYRSRTPSLIRVSNREFYSDRLVLPPSPYENDKDYGLMWHHVKNGIYTRGGKRNNRIEAEAIADALAEHARQTPDWSAGIVTFSSAQRNLMTEVLEHRRRADPVLDAFLREGHEEDVFVKNIENVQGDERDCIFISVGYGPTEPGGRVAMNFGPVNSEGGARRLNVLFSRARIQCRVFTSFDPGDMGETDNHGVNVLKRFLSFAKSGQMGLAEATGKGADSPFEEDVARVIQNFGYLVDHQVGSAGFLIDLGVRCESKPGQYMLAVECDGATYHSSLWARERDRLRQGVLEHLGWSFHRIWSTDWFHRRKQEIDRLGEALEAARNRVLAGVRPSGSNQATPAGDDDDGDSDDDGGAHPGGNTPDAPPALPESRIEVVPYRQADLALREFQNVGTIRYLPDPYSLEPHQWTGVISQIVALEGPMHQDAIAQRIGTAFDMNTTSKLRQETEWALKKAHGTDTGDGALVNENVFWMTEGQQNDPPIRNRSEATGSIRKGDMIPPVEIRKAAREIVQESGSMPPEELAREILSLLGFKRATDNLTSAVLPHLS